MKFYLQGVLLFLALTLFAQTRERVVSGQLKSNDDGSPLPGVNVVIKGTTVGTTTDAEGRYSISAPIGSVLVFSFIGMQTREVVVTETGLQSVNGNTPIRIKIPKGSWSPSILNDTIDHDREGVTTLDDKTPSYRLATLHFEPSDVISIRQPFWALLTNKSKSFVVHTNDDRYVPKGFALQFNGAVGFNTHGRLPKLQSSFGQGPDQNENMSWGPQIPDGTHVYNPYKFFRAGFNTNYDLTAWFPGIGRSTTSINVSRKKNQGIVPNNNFTINNISLTMKRIGLSPGLKGDVNVIYNTSDGTLMTRGANIANIVRSMMLTPPDVHPSYADGLVATFPDSEKSQRFLSAAGLTYDYVNRLNLNLNVSDEKQRSDIIYGVQAGYSPYVNGRRTERNEKRDDLAINFMASYNPTTEWENRTTVALGYQFRQEKREVSRTDGFGYTDENFSTIASADSLTSFDFSLTRYIHEISEKFQYERRGSMVRFINRHYFSNTARQNYVNLFPSLSVNWNLRDVIDEYFFDELKPFFSISRTLRESPAIFGNQAVLSTRLNAQQFNQYFENREITWNKQLNPEMEIKSEIGAKVSSTSWGNLFLNFSYYNNITSGLILPVWSHDQFVLTNAATVANRGVNVGMGYHSWVDTFNWGIDLRWTKYNSLVTSLDVAGKFLPLSGFSNIQTVVAEDQQLGAIYGTTFLRDAQGEKIIGNDGYPVVDSKLRKIGSPIPLYVISLEPYFNVRRFKLRFIVDFRKGGQVWNGTAAALDYYGRSKETSDLRDPALPLDQNPWLHNGVSGVGEEHIEDASWIRLNETSLSYLFYPVFNGARKEVTVAFTGRNLFLITPYKGVDPGTALFGYSNGTGLDLFNAPSLKSYNLSITIKL